MSGLQLTPLEASVLTYAAGMMGEQRDDVGISAAEKAAYDRAMRKLREYSAPMLRREYPKGDR